MLQMLTAITRAVSPAIVNCELSFIDRKPIDLTRAREQHHAYEKLLESLGARLVSLAQALAKFRKLEHITLPGTLEGGDVLRIGRKLFAGLTKRSNAEGIRQLAAILAPFPYEVIVVPVTGCLHLKSAVTCLGRNTLLANRAWFDTAPLAGHEWIEVDPDEPHAANALALGATIIFPASFPRTRARIEARGFHVIALDISELQKAESGLTCSSLLFEAP